MTQERIARLLSELEEVRGQLGQLREDVGLVARNVEPGKPVPRPRRVLTPEALEEMDTLERRERELSQAYDQEMTGRA